MDQIPKKVWVLVPHTKWVVAKNLKRTRARSPKWDTEFVWHKTYSMTSVERTLIECVLSKRLVGADLTWCAFKTALQKKITTLAKIHEQARNMAAVHRGAVSMNSENTKQTLRTFKKLEAQGAHSISELRVIVALVGLFCSRTLTMTAAPETRTLIGPI